MEAWRGMNMSTLEGREVMLFDGRILEGVGRQNNHDSAPVVET